MSKTVYLLFFVLILSCNNQDITNSKPEKVLVDEVVKISYTNQNKKIEVTINMDTDVVIQGEEIPINIKIKNKNENTVKLMFKNPSSAFGPWATLGTLVDVNTGKSKLKHPNKSILQSQFYSGDDLKEHYQYLKPNESISEQFNLTDIVVLNTQDYVLGKGEYRFQLSYFSNQSNTIQFIVK